MKRVTWTLLAAGVVVSGLAAFFLFRGENKEIKWRQAPVERGDIRQRISATGTLSALVQVNVGTQVSGTISDLFVDYNTKVSKGESIAQIDPILFQAAVEDATANVAKATASMGDAKRQYARAQRLHEQKLISDQDLEAAQVVAERAQGDLMSARASLSKAKANLGYCTIKAPVSGVVVSRAVDIGQTVAASFNTPTLFVIAQDLTKMKVLAAIDEADIGQVATGQNSQFTVDSFPDEQFKGTVSQVRLEPVTSQNVVTYQVQIDVDNGELRLRPGMTASVSILTHAKNGILKVPSAALRFNPLAFIPSQDKAKSRAQGGQGAPSGNKAAAKGMVSRREDKVWVLKEGKPVAIPVEVGITDGRTTEIAGEGIHEGLQILTGVEETKPAATSSGNTRLRAPGGRP